MLERGGDCAAAVKRTQAAHQVGVATQGQIEGFRVSGYNAAAAGPSAACTRSWVQLWRQVGSGFFSWDFEVVFKLK